MRRRQPKHRLYGLDVGARTDRRRRRSVTEIVRGHHRDGRTLGDEPLHRFADSVRLDNRALGREAVSDGLGCDALWGSAAHETEGWIAVDVVRNRTHRLLKRPRLAALPGTDQVVRHDDEVDFQAMFCGLNRC